MTRDDLWKDMENTLALVTHRIRKIGEIVRNDVDIPSHEVARWGVEAKAAIDNSYKDLLELRENIFKFLMQKR